MSSSTNPTPRTLKFIVLGDAGVGKTSLLARFCSGRFITFSSTIGIDFKWFDLQIDGEVVRLHLWDTAGQETYRSIAKPYYRQADGVLLVYNCTDLTTLHCLEGILKDVRENCPPGAVLTILANKADLVPELKMEEETGGADASVKATPAAILEGEAFARRNFIPMFFETSAKDGRHVLESFTALARHVLLVKKLHALNGVPPCTVCHQNPAALRCDVCRHDYCKSCCESIHGSGSYKSHTITPYIPEGTSEGVRANLQPKAPLEGKDKKCC
eukprot:PhF_6_TR32189/c1_g1_i2/m.47811/K06109/RAB13; Ras-related protein Rab-13